MLSSSRLAKLLRKMLAVGNVMNQGTERGQAAGFTLDSLLKMVDTKGERAFILPTHFIVSDLIYIRC